jgi:CheY-like chemotaxis protein
MSEVIKNVNLMMQLKAEEKGLELILKIPEDIPKVIGDPTRLRQVIINLVGNAIKFTEKGMVTTSLSIGSTMDENLVKAHFIVSDTGIGIDQDKLDKVFNSFEQAYADTSRRFGGTGLGLSISKKLIDLQSGEIWVESKKGIGSQFHFTLPFTVAATDKSTEVGSLQSNIEDISEQLKGIKVLLVEDNDFNAVVAREELEDAIEDVTVVLAENGAIAIEQVKHQAFDVILMDVQMPKMNGYDATKGIREMQGDRSKTPIIAMTANVLKEEVEACFNAGMDDFIGKPFDTEVLIQKIHSLIKINL